MQASEDVPMEETTPTGDAKYCIRRNGEKMEINPEKIKERIQGLADGLATDHIDFDLITQKVIAGTYDGKSLSLCRSHHQSY